LARAPLSLDSGEARARIADRQILLTLPGQTGVDVRLLYAAAYGALAQRKYDAALAAFEKAGGLAPEFALTKWKLGLLHEAMGNVTPARENFTRYQQLAPGENAQAEAALHLATLDAKRTKYDEEVDAAGDIV